MLLHTKTEMPVFTSSKDITGSQNFKIEVISGGPWTGLGSLKVIDNVHRLIFTLMKVDSIDHH